MNFLLLSFTLFAQVHKFGTDKDHGLLLHNKDLKWVLNKDAVVLVDMENVRGKTFFERSHREMLKDITLWTKLYNLEDRVSIIVDHGSEQTAYYLPEGGISMVFAGPSMKADDILARDVQFFDRNVLVVTSDNNLMSRCRSSMDRASPHSAIQFLKPLHFLKNLTQLNERIEREQLMLAKENPIKDKSSKRTLEKRSRMLCSHLASKEYTRTCSQNMDNLSILKAATTYDNKFEDEEILQWELDRQSTRRREKTKDRIFLAEHFRKKVKDESMGNDAEIISVDMKETSESLRYVKHIQEITSQ